jgi:CheY-like chemotaxis protein
VLYIEDEEKDIERMKNLINSRKFEIIGENYGEEAIKIIDRDRTIEAILLDIYLKDPKTGLDQRLQGDRIAEKIREIRPEIPIIAVSIGHSINTHIDGYFKKEEIFEMGLFKQFEEYLEMLIKKMYESLYYPIDYGTEWKRKWGREYIKFRRDPRFKVKEVQIGEIAKADYENLRQGRLKMTYRRYRGTDKLWNVLIARRVIFAAAFSTLPRESISGIDLEKVCQFLNFVDESGAPKTNDLTNFMHACGIAWGGILNGNTLLEEEKEWLKANDFVPRGLTLGGSPRRIILRRSTS